MLMGESSPLGDAIVPRLIRDRIDLSVYAVGGDSWAHSQNTGRFLETTLDNLDQFLSEMSAAGSRFSLVRTRGDLPVARLHDHVKFILHLEGGKPLQGGIGRRSVAHGEGGLLPVARSGQCAADRQPCQCLRRVRPHAQPRR
jgi:hypothetical protein